MEPNSPKIPVMIARFVLTLLLAFFLMMVVLSFWPHKNASGWGVAGEMKEIIKFGTRSMLLIALALMFSLLFSLASIALHRWLPLTTPFVFVVSAIPAIFMGYLILALFRAKGIEPHFFHNPTGEELFHVPFSYYLLPAFVLGISDGFLSELILHLRQEISAIFGERYIKHALAMGFSPLAFAKRDLISRSLRVVFSRATALLSGSIVVERIFGVRGIGHLIFLAADYKYAGFMFLIVVSSVIFGGGLNFVHYLLSLLMDARLRAS